MPSCALLLQCARARKNFTQKQERTCESIFACPPQPTRIQRSRYSPQSDGLCFSPVVGFKHRVPLVLSLLKSNIWLMELAIASKEPLPIRCPPSQLSSMKWMTDVWSVTVRSTKFCFAYGEMTSNGSLGP